jgi:ribosomal protein L40E
MEDDRVMSRHVNCEDCHNPHAANGRPGVPPAVGGALEGMSGVTAQGGAAENARFQYEVCMRCHADNPNVPPPTIRRQILQPSIRKKMQPSSPSSHPVMTPRDNNDTPSLLSAWSMKSQIYCTDCHANDSGPGAGGGGPAGPHGSTWPFLLEREYRTADNSPESYQSYAMCYKCHDRNSILGNASFPLHKKHIVDQRTPCSVCHDPHGISPNQGNPVNNSNLINFDVSIVLPTPGIGRVLFEDKGERHGQCTLTCHGKSHSASSY